MRRDDFVLGSAVRRDSTKSVSTETHHLVKLNTGQPFCRGAAPIQQVSLWRVLHHWLSPRITSLLLDCIESARSVTDLSCEARLLSPCRAVASALC